MALAAIPSRYINIERETSSAGENYIYFSTFRGYPFFEWQKGSNVVIAREQPTQASLEVARLCVSGNAPSVNMGAVKRKIAEFLNSK